MSIKLPEKFYVTRLYRSAEEVLGFMVVADNESTKTFKTAKARADRWASGTNALEPIYVDNVPKSGFRLVTNVSRYSTSNVIWRIMHPDGFEFEITSDNMCDLLATNTIIEGEFQDELFFTPNRKLVNSKTKLFADMIKREEAKKNNAVKVKDMAPGTLFEVPHNQAWKGFAPHKFVYCGKYHSISVNVNKPMVLSNKSSLKYVARELGTNQYRCFSSIPSNFSEKHFYDEIDRSIVISEYNEQIKNNAGLVNKKYADGYISTEISPIVINDKPFTKEQLSMKFVNVNIGDIDYIRDSNIYKHNNTRVFGFGVQVNGAMQACKEKKSYSNVDASSLLTYPISSIGDDNIPVIEVDLSEHKGIDYYNQKNSAFRSTNRYGYNSTKPALLSVSIPEELEVGYYTLGE